ncbi:phage head closure protein [Pyruvatibacter mobilis]|uniref:phage head closure protein n=1 Tax=Pyruvatibacter mobilis TaxID=1712261 RepID=UPI003BB16F7A
MARLRAARGIGTLRERVSIQERSETSDGGGGVSFTWANIDTNPTVSARVEPLRGFEQLQGLGLQGRVTHRVTLRYRSDVTIGNRFLWGTTGLEVKSPGINEDERSRYVTFLCEQGTDQAALPDWLPQGAVWAVNAARDQALVDNLLRRYTDGYAGGRDVDLSAGYDTITSPAQPTAVQGLRNDGVTAEPFPGWEAQGLDDAGWFWAVFRPTEANDNTIFDVVDVTGNNRIRAYCNDVPDAVQYQVISGGSLVVNGSSANSPALNSINAVAGRFSANDFALCLNGGSLFTDTNGVMPVGVVDFRVGWSFGLTTLNGGLVALAFGSGTKTDDELIELSARNSG